MLQVSKTCLLLVTFLLVWSFPAWSQTHIGENPQLVVSVYNDAGLSATVLTGAEKEAAQIFARAGLEVVWADCSFSPNHVGPDPLVRAGEASSQGSGTEPGDAGLRPAGRVRAPAPTWVGLANESACVEFDWPSHLALRLVLRSSRSLNEVFGVAFLSAEGTGCYSDVFLDQAMDLHAGWNIGLPNLLGSVIAHELGHLLLGSNSHTPTGIMTARWQREELLHVGRGNLLFTSEQAERMPGKLIAARLPHLPRLMVAARSSY